MKGRVDADLAREVAYQAWAARELLLRLKRPNGMVEVAIGAQRIDERGHFVAVIGRHPKCAPVTIGCGCSPSVTLFERERDALFAAVRNGAIKEADLLKRFTRSGAWQNREALIAALSDHRHPYDRSDIDQF